MKVLATSAARSLSERYILDFSGNKLRKFANENQSVYISDAKELFEALKGLIPKFKERNVKKQELLAAGLDDPEVFAQMQEFSPIFLGQLHENSLYTTRGSWGHGRIYREYHGERLSA